MAGRKDSPEMFEAFKIAKEERRRRAEGVPGQAPAAPEAPAPEVEAKKVEPAKGTEAGQKGTTPPARPVGPAVTRGVSNPGMPRPWSQATKTQEAAFYLPLGKRCQVVVAMSYAVAGVGAGVLVAGLVVAFVLGMMAGSPGEVQTGAGYEAETGGGQGVTGTGGTTAAGVIYRVQVVSVPNSERARVELEDMKTTLEGRGYPNIEIKMNKARTYLIVMVGWFTGDRHAEAVAMMNKLKREAYKGRFPFGDAYVVKSVS